MPRALSIALALLVALAAPHSFEARGDESAAKLVDLRPEFERLKLTRKSQGRRNTCSVFTTVGAMEFALSKKHDRAHPLSEEYLNWACNQVIGNKTADRGQFFHHLLQGFEKYGICLEAEMPYARKFHPEFEPSARAQKSAKQVQRLGMKARWIKRNDGTTGITEAQLEEIKKTLRLGWPVCAGSFHSVLFVGYQDDKALPGGGRFFVHDSANLRHKPMHYAEARKRLCDLLWYEVDLPKRR